MHDNNISINDNLVADRTAITIGNNASASAISGFHNDNPPELEK